MNLFEDEKIITTTDDNIIILTTHRIRSTNSLGWGHRETTSIMLDMVSSIKTTYNSYPVLLVIAAIIAIAGFILSNQNNSSYGVSFAIVLAIILVSIYFVTRKHVCVIASSGGSRIVFATSNMSHDSLISFIDRVEESKHKISLKQDSFLR
ncbi:hypothetical protein [Mucilaginibacter rubeus]|uniref:Uncharacterized protein n=1 Tax=Mucilaginibacter rubeus TaxID=2027860 RepID=A0A5C1I1P2_9SPHI|nr:hypothetical protein [Mucilaginibacter rubeus]QEM11759.1 hypothetical protein DEO27_017575 [Mucilaginibacter rubeus]